MQVKLPHCHREITRHGATVFYFRKGHRPRVRLPDRPGTPAFIAAYNEALNGVAKSHIPANTKQTHTLAWLIAEYRQTAEWGKLGVSTRRQRENIMKHVIASAGGVPFAAITEQDIMDGLDKRQATPHAARHFLDTMRNIFVWAKSRKKIAVDPTLGLKVHIPKTEGHKVWREAQQAAYEAHWPVGTRQRLAYDIYAFTGLRRGDASRLGPQHVVDAVACIKTEKSKFQTEVYIPICLELAESIAATPHCETAFITSVAGKPYTKESLGNNFRDWCVAAGLDGFSAHGLRKTSATEAADAGVTEHEMMSMYGWSEARTAGIYTKKANRRRLALQGAEKVKEGRKLPHPPAP